MYSSQDGALSSSSWPVPLPLLLEAYFPAPGSEPLLLLLPPADTLNLKKTKLLLSKVCLSIAAAQTGVLLILMQD